MDGGHVCSQLVKWSWKETHLEGGSLLKNVPIYGHVRICPRKTMTGQMETEKVKAYRTTCVRTCSLSKYKDLAGRYRVWLNWHLEREERPNHQCKNARCS